MLNPPQPAGVENVNERSCPSPAEPTWLPTRVEPEARPPVREAATPRISSKKLFGSARRLIIEHEGREYSLLITRQGKLVLNRSS